MRQLLFCLLIATLLAGCNLCDSLERYSANYPNKEERIAALAAEIQEASPMLDAEFKLHNVNGFSDCNIMVPGASYWHYVMAIKVAPENIDAWLEGMEAVDSIPEHTAYIKMVVNPRPHYWYTESAPEYYQRPEGNSTLILHRPEGILYKSFSTD